VTSDKGSDVTAFPRDRGHHATSPWQMPKAAWKDIAARTYKRTWDDNVGLVAAGVALYGFFALLSLLGALVLIYGMVADPAHVVDDFHALTTIFPRDVAALITQQLLSSVQSSETRKGLGIVLALLVALYGGTNGAAAMITSLNIAYEEKEKRSLWRFYLLAIEMAVVALTIALAAIAATAGVAYFQHLVPRSAPAAIVAGKVAGYLVLLLVATVSAATLYRFGPSREDAKWRWITPGSLFAAVMWLVLTTLFGFYVTSLTDYSATYGSLGAVVALLTWLYLSAYAFVFGAELNSEIEHQTAKDSTTGPPKPLGDRGAWAADTVAYAGDVLARPEEAREGERLTQASASIDAADRD
jgi:membrane protein